MPSFSSRGQASAEYVAVVALVACVLTAVTVVGAPGLPQAVTDRMEHALCVVGLDVCDAGHAAAQGLEPCVTSTEDRTRGTSGMLAVFDAGGSDRLVVEVLSDGRYRVSTSHETRAGVTAGVGLDVKGLVELSADVSGGAAFGSGTTLDLPDAAAVRALLGDAIRDPEAMRDLVRRIDDDLPADQVTRFRQLDARAGAEASADVVLGGKAAVDGLGLSAGAKPAAALGMRTRDGVRTYYYDIASTLDGPLADRLPAQRGRLAASWEAADPPVLTVTTASGRGSMETVLESRMVLEDPEDRRIARRWLLTGGRLADGAGRALAARMRDGATVQRLRYARQEVDEGAWGAEAKLGVGAGFEHLASVTRRQLVDAELLDRPVGGRRLDCLSSVARP